MIRKKELFRILLLMRRYQPGISGDLYRNFAKVDT